MVVVDVLVERNTIQRKSRDDVFGPTHACHTKAQKRNSIAYDWDDGGDSAPVFFKTAADFNKYATAMEQPRPLLQGRQRKVDSKVELDCHLERCESPGPKGR
ncbi:hypothetical protein QBC36DRAFT_357788 [Triangularia setosa]|uniref:Uncharacterized protein n=1 Tax=Triangularia setosa TaxID=2587417 RepID=A0AAN6W506_9PEZI|nr:hypothetical protein QBC36DRAFT_357788 [Podospora setosa]